MIKRYDFCNEEENSWECEDGDWVKYEDIEYLLPKEVINIKPARSLFFSWDEIPENYNYVAIDSDGSLYAHELEPVIKSGYISWFVDDYCNSTFIKDVYISDLDWKKLIWKKGE